MASRDLSETELARMQQEAIKRVQEMQRRARAFTDQAPDSPLPHPFDPPGIPELPIPRDLPPPSPVPPQKADTMRLDIPFLGSLSTSADTLLLMALLFILWKEKADIKILLALCYILLF